MRPALRAALATLLGLGLLVTTPPSLTTATASTTTTAQRALLTPVKFGMSYGERLSRMSPAELSSVLDDAKRLGVRWIRIDFSWTTIQPTGPSAYSWSGTDRVVKAARARGLRVLPILTYTPAWARDSGCVRFSCPPRSKAAFATFAKAAVKRYKGQGVQVWEVWNEPNLSIFWPNPNAKRYAALLKATSAAIKKTDPKARVLHGGLAALENRPPSIGPREFLRDVCRAGACGAFNGVSYHPYTFPYPASAYASTSAWSKISQTSWSLRSILRNWGRPKAPIWVTEYGAPTRGVGAASDGGKTLLPTTHVTEAWQAALLTDAAAQAVLNPNVHALFWYTNQDLAVADAREASFGLRRLDGSAKPAWAAYRTAALTGTS